VRRALRIVAFASLAAGGTVLGGWWTVPILAAIWVRVLPSDRRPVRTTALGAALGWLILVGMAALHGPAPALAARLSAVLELPRWGFPAATILFPALLAATAALLVKPASIT
jgi:hypothetical protein